MSAITIRVQQGVSKYDFLERCLPPFEIPESSNGTPKLPAEGFIVEKMLDHFGEYLVKSEGDLFLYNGVKWCHLENLDYLYKVFQKALLGKAKYRQLRDIINLFICYVNPAPRNLHTPNPHLNAFQNGTLSVIKIPGTHKWEIEFREHRVEDFVTTVIPHNFDPTREKRNPVFEQTLKNILPEDPESIRALKQMFGACLAPVYPRLFMLQGKPGRGKSTVMLLAVKLVSEENVSSVLPSDFGGFLAEGMIGKLVNYDTDIPSNMPIKDDVIKKIEDRASVSINRKGKKVVRTSLPPIHIFGANILPPTFERSVGAYERRWTFIQFNSFEAKESNYNKEILDDICSAGMEGVINFALEGLIDLLESQGHYFVKEEAKHALQEWQMENDQVEAFLHDVRRGLIDNVKIGEAKDAIRKSVVWQAFQSFIEQAYPNKKGGLHRNKFYRAIIEKGFKENIDSKGYDVFNGLNNPMLEY